MAASIASTEECKETYTVIDLNVLLREGRRFATVYADPPWVYGNQSTRAATSNHYDGLTVDEICALPVRDLVLPDAHLHLWTTNAFLFDCKRIMESWGFEYKSCMVWCKPQMGIGNYWRVCHEFLLLGIRGNAEWRNHAQKSWVIYNRNGHSVKPETFRRLVESASPPPRLELFGRRVATGWTVFGNQIERNMFDTEVREIGA